MNPSVGATFPSMEKDLCFNLPRRQDCINCSFNSDITVLGEGLRVDIYRPAHFSRLAVGFQPLYQPANGRV